MNISKKLLILLAVALAIRLGLAFGYEGTGDSGAFCNAGRLFLNGESVYSDPSVYFSGPPFALHITALMQSIGNTIGAACYGMWKMPSVVADVGIIYLLYVLANMRKSTKKYAMHVASWYAFNPVSLFISSYHGQQESFWLFFILAAYAITQVRPRYYTLSALLCGIALSYKLPAALLLPAVFLHTTQNRLQKIIFVAIVMCVFALSLFPEIVTDSSALITQSFRYSSIPGVWGLSIIPARLAQIFGWGPSLLDITSLFLKMILAMTIGGYYLISIRKKTDFVTQSLFVISIFLIFTPGFGTQYLLWPLPFLVLVRHHLLKAYTVFTTFAFLHFYGLSWPPIDWLNSLQQKHLYYPAHISYPFDLLIPVWILVAAFATTRYDHVTERLVIRKSMRKFIKTAFVIARHLRAWFDVSFSYRHMLMLGFLYLLIAFIFYAPAFSGYFQQDEWFFIPFFSRISQHPLAPIVAFLAPFRYPLAFAFHITPVGTFVWWLEISLFGLNYHAYIVLALIMHAALAVQITWLILSLFKNKVVAIGSAILFLTLSTHAQAVLWTNAHINTQLALMLGMGALQLFIHYVNDTKAPKRLYYGAIVLYLSSLLTKESMILLVFMLPLYAIIQSHSLRRGIAYKLLHASTIFYLFVRFVSPKIMTFWGADPNLIASISNKNTDPLFSIYWAVTLFLKAVTQSVVSQNTITQLTEWMTAVGYPHYNAEQAVRGTNYLTFTQSAGQDIVMYFIATLLIATIYFLYKRTSFQKIDRNFVKLMAAWVLFSTVPFTFLAGWLLKLFPYISTVDSRHLYVFNIGICAIIAHLTWATYSRSRTKSKSTHQLTCAVILVVFAWFISYQYQSLKTQIATQNKITDGREAIVKLLKKEVPKLGKQTLFYTTSNVALYGFAEMMLPFQNNPGQVILSIYAQEQKIPKDFLSAQFLMKGITEQWYETFDGMSIGYMLDKKSLYKTVLENKIDPKNVHAISYDGTNQTAHMISQEIRKELESVIARRAKLADWTTYTNELGSYSILIPPKWSVIPNDEADANRNISIYTPLGEYVMGIRIYEKGEGEPISDYVARLPEYAQYKDGQTAITFAQLKLGYLDSYTTVTNVDQALIKRYYFNTNNNLQIKEINVSTSYVSTEAGRAQVDELLYTLDFTN